MNAYEVTVSREGRWWVAQVEGVRGGATEARRLADLEIEVKDLLAGLLDADPDEIELHWHYEHALTPEAHKSFTEYRQRVEMLDRMQREFRDLRRTAVRELASSQVSVRDSAHLIGLSHQRVAQLLNDRGHEDAPRSARGQSESPDRNPSGSRRQRAAPSGKAAGAGGAAKRRSKA